MAQSLMAQVACAYALESVALRVGENADVDVAVDDLRKQASEPPVAATQEIRQQLEAEQRVARKRRDEHQVHEPQLDHRCIQTNSNCIS